ncbi:MAG: hypothetical protein QOD66_1491 [Solirubrobacteraceae bacterium]|nr:hypothetical protein [Solirubrobacteraceae bacterium]
MSELAPSEITVEALAVEDETSRKPLDDAGEARAVRFAGSYEMQRHGRCRLRAARAQHPLVSVDASPVRLVSVELHWMYWTGRNTLMPL